MTIRGIVALGLVLTAGVVLGSVELAAAVGPQHQRAADGCGVTHYCFPGNASATVSAPDDPHAGPMCGQIYCMPASGFVSYPSPPGVTVLSTANSDRDVTSQMALSWRSFPEAGQTVTVTQPITFDGVHLYLNGMTMLTPAGLDAMRALGGNFSSNGNDGLEYRPDSIDMPITLTVTVYQLPTPVGDKFNLSTLGALEVAKATSRTHAVQPDFAPMSVAFPTPVTLNSGTYLFSYRVSETPENLLTLWIASFTEGTIAAGKLEGQPSLDYLAGAAYLKGADYSKPNSEQGGQPSGSQDWLLHQARLTNNALPEYVIYGPGDVLLDLTISKRATTMAATKGRKACLRRAGYRWDSAHHKCVRRR